MTGRACCTFSQVLEKDAGYAWVVLACCMVSNFFCIGFLFGVIGVLTANYSKVLKVGIDEASWVGSILLLVVFISGPFAAYGIAKIGVRKISVISVAVHILAFTISGFATELWHVILSFAVFSGLACCCAHVCTMKILSAYFEKYQHMAFAAAAAGSDAAAVTLPYLTTFIFNVEKLSYLQSVLCMASLIFIALPCAVFLKEPHQQSVAAGERMGKDPTKESGSDGIDALPLLVDESGSQRQDISRHAEPTKNQDSQSELDVKEEIQMYEVKETINGDNYSPNGKRVEKHSWRVHINLLKTPCIIIFIVNSFLWNVGGAIVSVLSFSLFLAAGQSNQSASLAMTVFGVGSLLGSLLMAVVNAFTAPNKLWIHLVGNLFMGVAIIILPLLSFSEAAMITCIAVLGLLYGVVCANLGGVIEHINGSQFLYLVYGYEMAAAGIGSFIGPICGAKLEVLYGTGKGFYFGGSAAIAAFILFVVYILFNRSILNAFNLKRDKQVKVEQRR